MFKVKVPATTANLGPGFDVLGMALTRYSEFECEHSDEVIVEVSGLESHKINIENNLVIESMNHLFKYTNKYPKGYKLNINNNIPLARGMGSSAAAIIGGLLMADFLVGSKLSKYEILRLATDIEGHPDNVAPALFGNLVLSTVTENNEIIYKEITPFENLECVVFIPDYEVSTKDSRGVLPNQFSMKDLVHNMANTSLLSIGFLTGDVEMISKTMKDKIHEPYRKKLIKNFDELESAAINNGAFSFSLSGSGSTVIAYCKKENADNVKNAFEEVALKYGISGKSEVLSPCINGAHFIN